MAVKAAFAAATALAVAIALLLPVPRATHADAPTQSQIPTMEIGQG